MHKQWFIGFVEGEGCFNISFTKLENSKFGYHPRAMFIIKLTQSEKEVIEKIREYMGNIGNIYHESSESKRKTGQNNTNDCISIRVTKLEELEKIIKLLENETFISKQKRKDFENWKKCILLIKEKKHFEKEGFLEIARLRENMHTKKQSNKKGFCQIRNHIDKCEIHEKEQRIPDECNICYSYPKGERR